MKSIHVAASIRHLGLAALLAFFAAADRVAAQQTAEQTAEPEAAAERQSASFESLIDGLSSNKFRKRQASFDGLVEAGLRAVETLEQAAKSDSLEVATRCVEALAEIANDEQAIDAALSALRRLADDDTTQIAAFAAKRVKDLETTDEERAIAKLESLGVRIYRDASGKVRHLMVVNDRQAHFAQFLPDLMMVMLQGKDITDAAMDPILKLKSLGMLSAIDTSITADGIGRLKGLSGLTALSLGGEKLSADLVRHLADFPKLRTLSLSYDFDHETAALINQLGSLRQVSIQVSEYDDTQWGWMPTIKLPVAFTVMRVENVDDAGWEHLSRARVVRLLVYGSAFNDEALRHLGNAKELESLSVLMGDITDAGIAHLHGHPKLRTVRLTRTKVTEQAVAKLKKASPKLDRVSLSGGNMLPNVAAPAINFTDGSKGKNAHLRGEITPAIVKELKQTPKLATVFLTSLNPYDQRQLSLLVDVPIKRLFVRSKKFTAGGWRAIEKFPALESLSIHSMKLSQAATRSIGNIRSLQSLTISDVETSDEAVQTLSAALAKVGAIEKLSCYRCQGITDAALAGVGELTSLTQFSCTNIPKLSSGMLHQLAQLPNLRSLTLRDIQIRRSDLRQLAAMKKLTGLALTPLEQAAIGAEEVAAISELSSLQSLTLIKVNVPPQQIGSWGKISSLRTLAVGSSDFSDQSVLALRGLSELQTLRADQTKVGDAGVAAIAKQFPKLRELRLAETAITEAAIDHIIAMQNLSSLDLQSTQISGRGLMRLGKLEKLARLTVGDGQLSRAEESQFEQNHPQIKLDIPKPLGLSF